MPLSCARNVSPPAAFALLVNTVICGWIWGLKFRVSLSSEYCTYKTVKSILRPEFQVEYRKINRVKGT